MMWLWIFLPIAAVIVGVAVLSVPRCPAGWRPWVCYHLATWHSIIFCRWSARNACTIPEHGPAIIVSNHSSPVDPVIVWLRHFSQFQTRSLRLIAFMVAKEYVIRRDAVGWVCRAMQSIPVARAGRDMAAVQAALRRLAQGHLLGVFPEGKLNVVSPDDKLLAGGTGVGWLALKSSVPVIPVFIHNAPRRGSMLRSFFHRTRASVTYGQPVDLTDFRNMRLTHTVVAQATDRIMQALAKLGGVEFTPVDSGTMLQPTSTATES